MTNAQVSSAYWVCKNHGEKYGKTPKPKLTEVWKGGYCDLCEDYHDQVYKFEDYGYAKMVKYTI